MHRIILIFFILLAPSLYAQRFHGGFMAGMAGSQVDGDSYAGYNKINGLGGAFVQTLFSDRAGAQMEIKYCGKGAREKQDEPNAFFHKLSLHYLEIPLLFDYFLTDDLYPEIGFSPSLLMGKTLEDASGVIPKSAMPDYKGFDLGGIIGINYQFNDRWIANLRYTYSLLTIREHINDNDYYYNFFAKVLGYDQGDYNNVLSVSVYYILSSK